MTHHSGVILGEEYIFTTLVDPNFAPIIKIRPQNTITTIFSSGISGGISGRFCGAYTPWRYSYGGGAGYRPRVRYAYFIYSFIAIVDSVDPPNIGMSG